MFVCASKFDDCLMGVSFAFCVSDFIAYIQVEGI